MDVSSSVVALRETLEPAMTERGFGSSGPGFDPDGGMSLLFCIGATEFAARWPMTVTMMRRRIEIDDDVPGACLDLVLEISPTGDIRRADFEFVGIDTLLSDLGHHEAARRCSLDALRHLDATELASRICAAVELLMP